VGLLFAPLVVLQGGVKGVESSAGNSDAACAVWSLPGRGIRLRGSAWIYL